jgi:hypothetical protein
MHAPPTRRCRSGALALLALACTAPVCGARAAGGALGAWAQDVESFAAMPSMPSSSPSSGVTPMSPAMLARTLHMQPDGRARTVREHDGGGAFRGTWTWDGAMLIVEEPARVSPTGARATC